MLICCGQRGSIIVFCAYWDENPFCGGKVVEHTRVGTVIKASIPNFWIIIASSLGLQDKEKPCFIKKKIPFQQYFIYGDNFK